MPADRERQEIFRRLKAVLRRHIPPFVARTGNVSGKPAYHLWSEREVEIAGRKRREVYFAGIIQQKGYVGFYYMPVYTEGALARAFPPQLLRTLKGKSCFHIRALDRTVLRQIEDALEVGLNLYRKRGWV